MIRHFKSVEELTFSDNFMFNHIMQYREICKEILETLLKIKIAKIEYIDKEKTLDISAFTKGIRLDVYIKDSDRIFDIEIQNYKEKSLGKRLRFYQSMIDADFLQKGKDYEELKETVIIFICKYDPFNKGFSCYEFNNFCIQDKNLKINDEVRKIIFNTSCYSKEKDIAIKEFLKYIETGSATNVLTQKIETIVERLRSNNSFRDVYMNNTLYFMDLKRAAKTEGFNEGFNEGFRDGFSDGITAGSSQKALETAKNMINKNIPIEIISECTELSLEVVKNLAKEITSN